MNPVRVSAVESFLKTLPPHWSGYECSLDLMVKPNGIEFFWEFTAPGVGTQGQTFISNEGITTVMSASGDEVGKTWDWPEDRSVWEHQAAEISEQYSELLREWLGCF